MISRKGMKLTINVKDLRGSLPKVVERVRKGARYTVLYRSRPAFQIVPVDEPESRPFSTEADPLYGARAVGRSKDGLTAAEHDDMLYGR
jgi:prevent-host-death family protein